VRSEQPELFDEAWASQTKSECDESTDAVRDVKTRFAEARSSGGVVGMSAQEMRQYRNMC